MAKKRLDVLLCEKGFFDSRERAKAVIMAGQVYVNGQKSDKAGVNIDENAQIQVRGDTLKYVSRGGLKLEKALDFFGGSPEGKTCIDCGASTGGFTDVMLRRGA
ncbi:MAG: TlyA family RNA methyltransferase, partial [Oscillospiraceae bacterium]|nr:TlyA family RNA methyltransferase [Oscillospiraceae bacterium]